MGHSYTVVGATYGVGVHLKVIDIQRVNLLRTDSD